MMENKILLETGTNEMELLAVTIDGQLFGINVAKVQAIEQFDFNKVTKMPNSPPGIQGMLLYRKKNIPLVDLPEILKKEDSKKDNRDIIVITEFNNATNSFRVHGVKQIYRISWNKLTPMESDIFGNNSYVTGSVCIKDEEILVLDLEHILANLFPELAIETVTGNSLKGQETIQRDDLNLYFAEDSQIIRAGVVNALNRAGFTNIKEFDNGQSAYHYLSNRLEQKDVQKSVLISDIEMPMMDGLTLCRKIKNNDQLNQLHVTMFSSLINDQMIDKCKSVGADNYVTKPEVNKLIHILDEFIN